MKASKLLFVVLIMTACGILPLKVRKIETTTPLPKFLENKYYRDKHGHNASIDTFSCILVGEYIKLFPYLSHGKSKDYADVYFCKDYLYVTPTLGDTCIWDTLDFMGKFHDYPLCKILQKKIEQKIIYSNKYPYELVNYSLNEANGQDAIYYFQAQERPKYYLEHLYLAFNCKMGAYIYRDFVRKDTASQWSLGTSGFYMSQRLLGYCDSGCWPDYMEHFSSRMAYRYSNVDSISPLNDAQIKLLKFKHSEYQNWDAYGD